MKNTSLGDKPVRANSVPLGKERSQVQPVDSNRMKIKRAFDLGVAVLFLLTVCSWLFPIIAIFVKLSSKGPVFFKQLRHGEGNVPFYCYKFRTMVLNDQADTLQAKKTTEG